MKMNRVVKITGILIVGMLFASACTRTYSPAPVGTPSLIPTSLFVSPFPTNQDQLQAFSDMTTQTAQSATETAGGPTLASNATASTPAAGTPAAGTPASPVAGTPATQSSATELAVTIIPNGSTFTPTPTTQPGTTAAAPTTAARTPAASTSTSAPVGTVPGTYTLQKGEWPFCIARRFDVNPDQLLNLSGLTAAESTMLMPGRVLTIPQTGDPFPASRAWHAHPDTYTVDPGDSVYSIACYYGDLTPQQIATANNISVSTTLTTGQSLTIP